MTQRGAVHASVDKVGMSKKDPCLQHIPEAHPSHDVDLLRKDLVRSFLHLTSSRISVTDKNLRPAIIFNQSPCMCRPLTHTYTPHNSLGTSCPLVKLEFTAPVTVKGCAWFLCCHTRSICISTIEPCRVGAARISTELTFWNFERRHACLLQREPCVSRPLASMHPSSTPRY